MFHKHCCFALMKSFDKAPSNFEMPPNPALVRTVRLRRPAAQLLRWASSVVVAQLSDHQILALKAIHHAMLVCYSA